MSEMLGFCAANSDTLYQSGVATATWTPSAGGGTLLVDIPKGPQCMTPVPSGTPPQDYFVQLTLGRVSWTK